MAVVPQYYYLPSDFTPPVPANPMPTGNTSTVPQTQPQTQTTVPSTQGQQATTNQSSSPVVQPNAPAVTPNAVNTTAPTTQAATTPVVQPQVQSQPQQAPQAPQQPVQQAQAVSPPPTTPQTYYATQVTGTTPASVGSNPLGYSTDPNQPIRMQLPNVASAGSGGMGAQTAPTYQNWDALATGYRMPVATMDAGPYNWNPSMPNEMGRFGTTSAMQQAAHLSLSNREIPADIARIALADFNKSARDKANPPPWVYRARAALGLGGNTVNQPDNGALTDAKIQEWINLRNDSSFKGKQRRNDIWGQMSPEQQKAASALDQQQRNKRPGHKAPVPSQELLDNLYAAPNKVKQADPSYDVNTGKWSNIPQGLSEADMNNSNNAVALNAALQAWHEAGSPADKKPKALEGAGTHITHDRPDWMNLVTPQSTNMLQDAQGNPVNIAYDTPPTVHAQNQNQPWHDAYSSVINTQTSRSDTADGDYNAWSDEITNAATSAEYKDLFGPNDEGFRTALDQEGHIIKGIGPLSGFGFNKSLEIFGKKFGTDTDNRFLGDTVDSTSMKVDPRTGEMTIDPTDLFAYADQLLQQGVPKTRTVMYKGKGYNAGDIINKAELYRNMGIDGPKSLGFMPDNRLASPETFKNYDIGEGAKTLSNDLWKKYTTGKMTDEEMSAFEQEFKPVAEGTMSLSDWYRARPEARDTLNSTIDRSKTPTHDVYEPKDRSTRFIKGWGDGLRGDQLKAYVQNNNITPWEKHPGIKEYFKGPGGAYFNHGGRSDFVETPEGIKPNATKIDHPILDRAAISDVRDFDRWIIQKWNFTNNEGYPWAGDRQMESYANHVIEQYKAHIRDKGSNIAEYHATEENITEYVNSLTEDDLKGRSNYTGLTSPPTKSSVNSANRTDVNYNIPAGLTT